MNRTILRCYALLGLSTIVVSFVAMEQTAVVLATIAGVIFSFVVAASAATRALYRGKPVGNIIGAFLVTVLILGSVGASHWPLRVAYVVSRPALERAAAEVRLGHPFEHRRVGLIEIRRAEISRTGVVCLWTDTNPSGRTGFVQTPPYNIPFNLWSVTSLDQRWQFISED